MKKCIPLIIVLAIIIGYSIFSFCANNFSFFEVKLHEIIALSIGIYVSYFLTKRDYKENKIKEKIENVVSEVEDLIKLDKSGHDNLERTLNNMRLVRRKINFIKDSVKLFKNIEDDANYIEKQFNTYSDEIARISKPLKEYDEKDLNDVQKYLTDIEIRLNDIMTKIYELR